MKDLSYNPEIKKFCRFLCVPPYHEQNLQRIENRIIQQKATHGYVDWFGILGLCRDYIRMGVNQYRPPPLTIRLPDKIAMADNLLEYFKNKHGHK